MTVNDETSDHWVEVRRYDWLHDAKLAKSALAGAGIEAQVPNARLLGLRPLIALVYGGVSVLVHEDDLHRATILLESSPEPTG